MKAERSRHLAHIAGFPTHLGCGVSYSHRKAERFCPSVQALQDARANHANSRGCAGI